MIPSIGTYLPPWGDELGRQGGLDEDAVTMGVAAGRLALAGCAEAVSQVVLISRGLPLLEGGNAAALLGGLGLPATTDAVEQVGGAAAVLDALVRASPGTLVIGVDLGRQSGASAAVIGEDGVSLRLLHRLNRSLPVVARDLDGNSYDYEDPRLLRDRGIVASLATMGDPNLQAIAGVEVRQARGLCAGDPPALPTVGASATLFCLASDSYPYGARIAAADQASLTVVELDGGAVKIQRDERAPQPAPNLVHTPGLPIPISLSAYDRAFDAKLRWQASTNATTNTLDFPPRPYDAVRSSGGLVELVDLPRHGVVYTSSTIRVPVPGKATPYQLVIVELDGAGIRALVPTTGTREPVAIGTRGELVLRRLASRSGIPDYGYAFRSEEEPVS